MGLSTLILAGVLLGVATGLFFGEYTAFLSVVGDAFVGLLQMTVLPYIAIALVSNIGRLSIAEGRRFGLYAGCFVALSLLVTMAAILLLPLALPARESASFFSTGSLQEPADIDLLALFIPSNPFNSLANNAVPAVVLFCIAVGLSIVKLDNKELVLDPLDLVTNALSQINRYLVKATPVGVFAIVASMAGSMQLEELARLEAYLLLFTVAAFVVAYGVLLPLLAALTPFSYSQLFKVSRAPVLTAFATGKVFVVLPMLVTATEELFGEVRADARKATSYSRAVTPLVYPFPHAGKLLALLFVPFAAWFVDQPIRFDQYPAFLGSGLFSLFGSPMAAIPFLLDQLRLPADMFQLFVVSGVLASRLGDMVGAIHLLFVSVLTACALTIGVSFDLRRLLPVCAFIVVLGAVAMGGTRAFLASSLDTSYDKDQIIRGMHSALHTTAAATVHREIPARDDAEFASTMARIGSTGVLRVGYHADNLPSSFFNVDDVLVGYDIDMANLLAQHLQCRLEFVPFRFPTLATQLERGDFDLAMSGVTMLPARLARMRFTEPYTEITAALLVPDHRREEFEERMVSRTFDDLVIAVGRVSDAAPIAHSLMPRIETVTLPSLREFLESGGAGGDAMIWTAEGGAAWTLVYPGFSVVVIRPVFRAPVGFPVATGNEAFANFTSRWIQFARAAGYTERLYKHWILGETARRAGPRWSVMGDVLGWVE